MIVGEVVISGATSALGLCVHWGALFGLLANAMICFRTRALGPYFPGVLPAESSQQTPFREN